jgi:hypothetical protein
MTESFPYTAHEVMQTKKEIPLRIAEIKRLCKKKFPDKTVTFDTNPPSVRINGFYTLKYTIL